MYIHTHIYICIYKTLKPFKISTCQISKYKTKNNYKTKTFWVLKLKTLYPDGLNQGLNQELNNID